VSPRPCSHCQQDAQTDFFLWFEDHIWDYDGYGGYDASSAALQSSEVRQSSCTVESIYTDALHSYPKEYKVFTRKLRQTLAARSNWLTQEFAFWETAAPHESATPDPIYELRTYHLKPGMLLEWESSW
jgi:hypothetical protein